MIDHILLAVDGSVGARAAAAFARSLVQGTSTRLTVLLVLEPPSALVIPVVEGVVVRPPHPSPEDVAAARTVMEEIEAALGHTHVTSRIETGHPAEVICAVADALAVDLIVVGDRGQNPVTRWLLGSVSDRVVRHAHQPVTVVRSARTAFAGDDG